MSEATDLLEHMEHAAHGGGHGDHGGGDHGGKPGPGKQIGVTMAILGVMLALCAAMVGSQRTELVRSMVEQSTKFGLYQAEAMKFRVVEADVELLKAISPKKDEVAKIEATLRSKRASSGHADDEDTAEIKDLIASATEDMADLLTPDPEELVRFKKLASKYELDMKEAKEDAEAYDGRIEAHQEAAEWYERAQLAAEIGIVIASVALLMASRKVWTISVALGLTCAVIGTFTAVHTHSALVTADAKIEAAAKNMQSIEADDEDDDGKDDKAKGGEKKAEKAGEKKDDKAGEKKDEKGPAEKAKDEKKPEKKGE
jgi:hypothetical protein